MKDTEYKRTKAKVKWYFDRWITPLGLNWWRVDIDWYTDGAEFVKHSSPGNTAVAFCDSDWRYMMATISINLPAFVNLKDDQIENIVVHELCHILVNEMRENEIHHEERVTETLARAFLWTRVAARKKHI